MTLRDALIKAMSRRQSDGSRADAVLKVLGLSKNEVLVDADDLAHLMAYVDDARAKLDGLGYHAEGWDDEDHEILDRVFEEFLVTLPPRLKETT